MSEQGGQERGAPGGEAEDAPRTEEELRAALDEELRRVRVEDLLIQSVASIVNLTARRIGKEDERDLEQAKVGIDAVRALVGLLPEEPARQVREALSQLQVLYAQTASGAGGAAPAESGEGEGAGPAPQPPRREAEPPPAPEGKPPPRLWTPPGSS